MVDFPGVESFRITDVRGLQALKNHSEIDVDDNWNLELVFPTMESHKGFRHVHSHSFMVFAIFEVLLPGCFTLKYLEAVQTEVVFVLVLIVPAHK